MHPFSMETDLNHQKITESVLQYWAQDWADPLLFITSINYTMFLLHLSWIFTKKNDFIGGRTKSINIEGDNIELGASMLIHDNQYMLNLVHELQLHPQPIKQRNTNGRTAIWNAYNKQFSFISYDSNSWLSLPYTLWHFSPKKKK
eukprot:967188_1